MYWPPTITGLFVTADQVLGVDNANVDWSVKPVALVDQETT
jgi:hypothetical protein